MEAALQAGVVFGGILHAGMLPDPPLLRYFSRVCSFDGAYSNIIRILLEPLFLPALPNDAFARKCDQYAWY